MSMEELHKAWYDHVLKGAPPPALLKTRVACFVMGRNTWIHASDLQQLEGAAMKLELDLTGAIAGDVTRSGRLLAQAPPAHATVTLTSDPMFLPPRSELDTENLQYLKDQRDTYTERQSQVVWHSAPFPAETIFAGRPRLQLQLSTDEPDADLWISLSEVLPDGSAIFLSSSAIRLRYRKGGVKGIPMVSGKPEHIEIPAMSLFARSIAKGSRLRLVVSAAPRFGWQRNSHTGGDLVSEPVSRGRIAKITLITGPGSGSTLELPRPEDTLFKTH
jgi:hypothetical protein